MQTRTVLATSFVLIAIAACSSSADKSGPALDDGGAGDGAVDPDGAAAADGAADGAADAGPTAPPEWKSGTRLRANVHKSAGGSTIFVSWHDTKLDVDCRFGKADDGSTRCLPLGYAQRAFANAACSVPVIAMSACAPAKMVSVPSADGCSVTAYQTTTKLGTLSELYAKNGAACDVQPAPAASDFYDGTLPVGATELVGATEKREARGADLEAHVLVADDGTIDARTIGATQRGYVCELSSILQPNKHCLPSELSFAQGFAEGTCTTPASIQPHSCGGKPALVQKENTLATCDFFGDGTYAEVGTEITGETYSKSSTCTATPRLTGVHYWTVGADVPLTSLPAIASKDEGTDRLRVRAFTSATGDRLFGATFYDGQRNEVCAAGLAADDKLRCLPPVSGLTGVSAYKDMGCTQPVLARAKGCTPPTFAAASVGLGCSARPHYYAVGAVTSVTTIYGGTPCVAQTVDSGSDYYALTEIPPTDFAEVTAARE